MISNNPIVSIFGSSARPNLWNRLIKSLEKETLPFEIIYAGPSDLIVDKNVRYVKSYFKPTQCMQIAAMFARGEFLLHVVDDLVFCEDKPLTKLLDDFKKLSTDKSKDLILSTRLRRNGVPFNERNYYLFNDNFNSFIPISIFIKKSFFLQLGGLDRSFITCMADADLIYRAVSSGAGNFYFSDVYVEEDKSVTKLTLFEIYGMRDLSLLIDFWFVNEIFSDKNRPKFEPFNKMLLNRNSPNGVWMFNSQLSVNFFKYLLFKFFKLKKRYEKLLCLK